MKLPPCTLCWYQRICLYPLVVLLPVGILRGDHRVHLYALPLVVIGLGIAAYHNLLYYGVIPQSLSPCTAGAACNARQIDWLGFIGIPLLGLGAFVFLLVDPAAAWKNRAGRTPRRGQRMNKQAKVLGIAAVALVGATVLARLLYSRSKQAGRSAGAGGRRRRGERFGLRAAPQPLHRAGRRQGHHRGVPGSGVRDLPGDVPDGQAGAERVPGQGAAGDPLHAVSSELPVRRQRPGGGGRAEEVLGDAGGDVREPAACGPTTTTPGPS